MGVPAFGVYTATKAALRSFVRTWSVDLKGRGIRVNVVSPGTIRNARLQTSSASRRVATGGGRHAPGPHRHGGRGRQGRPFLASDDSSYVTGAELFVDGGAAQV